MALGDVKIISPGGLTHPPSMVFRTEASSTQIFAGDPVIIGGTGTNYVIVCPDAHPLLTDTYQTGLVGIAATTGPTAAAAVAGTVEVALALPGIVYACKAKTSTTFDTDAELLAVLNDNVYFDLATTTYTIDVANASAAGTGGLRIVGGDVTNSIVYFVVHVQNTYFA